MDFFKNINRNELLSLSIAVVGGGLAFISESLVVKVVCGVAGLIALIIFVFALLERKKFESQIFIDDTPIKIKKKYDTSVLNQEGDKFDVAESQEDLSGNNDQSYFEDEGFAEYDYDDDDFKITKMPAKLTITEEKRKRKRSRIFSASKKQATPATPVNHALQVNMEGARADLLKNFLALVSQADPTEAEQINKEFSLARVEFISNLNQVLEIISRQISSHSVMFFWVNPQTETIIPEVCTGQDKFNFKKGVGMRFSRDIISRIATKGVPEIITDLSDGSEAEMIRYYIKKIGVKSFIGLPIFFHNEIIGILACDSKTNSQYDERTLVTLSDYLRLIGNLILGYTKTYDYELPTRGFTAFNEIQKSITGSKASPDTVAKTLATQASLLVGCEYAAVMLFDENIFEWKIAASAQKNEELRITNLTPDIDISLAGKTTRTAQEIYLEKLDKEIRFSKSENITGKGSLLVIPLLGAMKCYGSITIESSLQSAFVPHDIVVVRALARYAAMAIEVAHSNKAIETTVIFDEPTGFFNRKHLLNELSSELERCNDFSSDLSLVLVSPDSNAGLQSISIEDFEEFIFKKIGVTIATNLHKYEFMGRYSESVFAVVLIGKKDQDAYLWAEKIRKDVSGKIINVRDKKIAITLSLGVNDFQKGVTTEVLINGASLALNKAVSSGGNTVVLY